MDKSKWKIDEATACMVFFVVGLFIVENKNLRWDMSFSF